MLGPFVLHEPLGHGGMAVVWDGYHLTRQVPVAVKIMRGDVDAESLRWWRREVRAVASLQHPGVVQVLDVGELPQEVRSLGLTPGAPYLVMERAQGTLRRPPHGLALRSALLQLLDALAHAHARGVVHLDLKGSNVLVGGERPGLRLTDFGLAQAWRAGRSDDAGGRGTPSHMAPEQIDGGALGPWSDLYALGVLAWRMATGTKPYRARNLTEAAAAMARPLPPFVPDLAVPAGFGAWVQALLQRDPSYRFQRAADAAYSLLQLDRGGWEGREGGVVRPAPPDAVTLCFAPVEPSLSGSEAVPATPTPDGPRVLRPMVPPVPPFPGGDPGPGPSELLGAGVGLFALRDVGVVGREPDQRWLWRKLRQVAAEGRSAVVALSGPSGAGTSRLARWLCERAHEVGGGELLVARHGPNPEPGHGLGPMLAAAFHVVELSYDQVVTHLVERGLHPLDARGLGAVIQPVGAQPIHAPRERVRVVLAGLRLLALDRALVVWLDDVRHDADSLALVEALRDAADLAAVVVLTGAPVEVVPPGDVHEVSPLDEDSVRQLVKRSLGVSKRVEDAVVRRAEGLPLFALQLLHLLVARGELVRTARGLQASIQALDELPASLASTYRARVEAVAPAAVPALQLAALLGHHVPLDEWTAGTENLGLSLLDADVEALLGAGLLRAVPLGYAFEHDGLREGLGVPRAQGVAWHGALADVVSEPERRAHHLLLADEPERALEPLEVAANALLESGASRRAEALWQLKLEALDAAGRPPDDVGRAAAWLRLVRARRVRGAWEAARETCEVLLAQARAHGWTRYESNALSELALDRHNAGDLQGAQVLVREAYTRAEGLPASRASAALARALWAIDAGAGAVAREMAEETLAIYASQRTETGWSENIGAGYAHSVLGRLASREGRQDVALRHLERANEHFSRTGDRLVIADARNYRAGVLLAMGRVSDAEADFLEALEHYEAIGVWSALLVRINLAVLAIDSGRVEDARQPLEAALRQLVDEGRQAFAAAVRGFLLPCLVHADEPERFLAEAAAARAGLDATGFVDSDVARIATRAAEAATARGWDAADAVALAAAQSARLS